MNGGGRAASWVATSWRVRKSCQNIPHHPPGIALVAGHWKRGMVGVVASQDVRPCLQQHPHHFCEEQEGTGRPSHMQSQHALSRATCTA